MNGNNESMKNIWRVACAFVVMVGSLVTISTARADVTTKKSKDYTQECFDKGVPLPPVWGTVNNFWKYSGQLPSSEVFIDTKTPTDIYYFLSSPKNADGTTNHDYTRVNGELHLGNLANPEGVCMAAIRKAPNTQTCDGVAGQNYTEAFSVICQGKNGNACFWNLKKGNTLPWSSGSPGKAIQPSYSGSNKQCLKTTVHPNGKMTDFAGGGFLVPSFDIYIVQYGSDSEGFDNRTATNSFPTWVGGASLVGNKEGICTACHAGENVFINHPGSATDINPLSPGRKTSTIPTGHYFPSTWPNPIIPSADVLMGGFAWPQNPPPLEHYNSVHTSSTCFTCHDKGKQGGRFPKISDLAALDTSNLTKNYCHNVLYPSITRTSGNGVMPPGSTTKALDNDPFSKAMWHSLCSSVKAPKSAENGITAAQDFQRGRIHKSAFQSGFHEHSFSGRPMPSTTSAFLSRDKICVDGLVSNTGNLTPSQVAIQFLANDGQAGDTWNHRAYWGANKIGPIHGWPASGSVGNFQVSDKVTPKGRGYWNQYCVTAGSVGLTQKNISGIKFTLFDGSMWWGSVYYYRNGGGTPQTLFTTPLDVPRSAAGGDFWDVVRTPAYLFWNPAMWSSQTFAAGNEGTYGGADQFGNISLGLYKDNYCYMNAFANRAGDEVALSVKGQGGSGGAEWWSLGASFNAPSGQSMIGANCIPWKELTTGTTRGKTTIPSVLQTGMFLEWHLTGNNGQTNPSPPPSMVGGWPSTNLCVLNGLYNGFSTTNWSSISIYGSNGADSASAWWWINKAPQGYTMCGNIGIGTLSPVPASAYTRGGTSWYRLNQKWSGSGGSVDLSALFGSGKDANNQFCYLVGAETSAGVTGSPSAYVAVADGTNIYTDQDGKIIPAGHWVVWGQNGMTYVRVGCQSTPI